MPEELRIAHLMEVTGWDFATLMATPVAIRWQWLLVREAQDDRRETRRELNL